MKERPKYIFVVAGIMDFSANYDGVNLCVNEKYGAHHALDGAQRELYNILREAQKERPELAYEMGERDLDIYYDDGTFEEYHIYKMILN